MTATLVPSSQFVELEARRHPQWCENGKGEFDPAGCGCADEDYAVIHGRGARHIDATETTSRKPIAISVDICRALLNGETAAVTSAEIVIPGGHADLTRDQLQLLIAELQHIDSLWEMS